MPCPSPLSPLEISSKEVRYEDLAQVPHFRSRGHVISVASPFHAVMGAKRHRQHRRYCEGWHRRGRSRRGIEVTDIERGQTFKTTTSEAGEYVASPLHVGRYKITVAKTGFKKAVSEIVELNVQGRVAVNVTLQVGQINEEMVVTGAAPLLETETSELGQVVDQMKKREL